MICKIYAFSPRYPHDTGPCQKAQCTITCHFYEGKNQVKLAAKIIVKNSKEISVSIAHLAIFF
jgi:hypothetical protein